MYVCVCVCVCVCFCVLDVNTQTYGILNLCENYYLVHFFEHMNSCLLEKSHHYSYWNIVSQIWQI